MPHQLLITPAIALALSAVATPVYAATADEAKALSERAAAYISQVGEAKAFADFTRSDGGFTEGEL